MSSLKNNDLPQHTPELARLLSDMETKGAALSKVARRNQLAAFKSPEYKAHHAAWKAYWNAVDAVDADKLASKPA